MIEYVQVRNANFEIVGIIDTAKSIIWHKKYYGVGDFEIYAQATQAHVNLLQIGNYISRLNDDEIGIVEKIEIQHNQQDGLMIVASGRFAKSILDRRIIYTLSGTKNSATTLTGNVESAARALVANNATACSFNTKRNISFLELGAHSGSTEVIVDDSGEPTTLQVVNDNLLEYTDALLQEYKMSAKVIFSDAETKLQYVCFRGIDRSTDNASGIDSVIFSSDFDNLTNSDYSLNETNIKNMALIGGEGEGLDKFYSSIESDAEGIERREIFVNGSQIQRKYTDDEDVEQEYTDQEYKAFLDSLGKSELAQHIQIEAFSGTINTASEIFVFGIDYSLGDIVTVQDNEIGVYANVRIVETTEVQDENGYSVSLNYE